MAQHLLGAASRVCLYPQDTPEGLPVVLWPLADPLWSTSDGGTSLLSPYSRTCFLPPLPRQGSTCGTFRVPGCKGARAATVVMPLEPRPTSNIAGAPSRGTPTGCWPVRVTSRHLLGARPTMTCPTPAAPCRTAPPRLQPTDPPPQHTRLRRATLARFATLQRLAGFAANVRLTRALGVKTSFDIDCATAHRQARAHPRCNRCCCKSAYSEDLGLLHDFRNPNWENKRRNRQVLIFSGRGGGNRAKLGRTRRELVEIGQVSRSGHPDLAAYGPWPANLTEPMTSFGKQRAKLGRTRAKIGRII